MKPTTFHLDAEAEVVDAAKYYEDRSTGLGSELLGIPSWPAQQKVAEKALGIEAAREKLAEQLSAIETLPAAFLRQAFRGEL